MVRHNRLAGKIIRSKLIKLSTLQVDHVGHSGWEHNISSSWFSLWLRGIQVCLLQIMLLGTE